MQGNAISRRGFTLIELLVVVAIIGFIASIVIPGLLRMSQEARGRQREASAPAVVQGAPQINSVAREGRLARPPVVENAEVLVELSAFHVLERFEVHTLYRAKLQGTFVIRNIDPQAERLDLKFPFPLGVNEARDVSLRLLDPETGAFAEPEGVAYAMDGCRWSGPAPPGSSVTAQVAYSVEGKDAFSYDLAGAGRSEKVRLELRLLDVRSPRIPVTALPPTEIGPDRLVWSLDRLVTTRRIVVELPGAMSPQGRVILLSQLAGLAVLLFGAGFWYLTEGREPGRLRTFRLGHFLLLALTYSLFFAIFAVASLSLGTLVALAAAAGLSLPLFVLHVSRLLPLRFTLTRILPLAGFTLGVVVAGVYAEEWRPFVFLAAAVLILAFVTLTWPGWSARRAKHLETLRAEEARHRQEAEEAGRRKLRSGGAGSAEDGTRRPAHCMACGAGWPQPSRFCPDCGVASPWAFECRACGEKELWPRHLFKDGWEASALHCRVCGSRAAAQR